MKKDLVYVGMCADIVHKGHLNILNEAAKHGEVVVGLLSDEAIISYKRLPSMDFAARKIVVENIKAVSQVVKQDSLSYVENLKSLKPKYVVHGDDWKSGVQKKTRQEVIDTLSEWGGQLIEVAYTPNISSTVLNNELKALGISSTDRMSSLRKMMEKRKMVRVIEVHNGLTGLIVEKVNAKRNDRTREFDAMWLSSLTHSSSKGKPDIQYVDISSISQTIGDVFEVSTKPMIVDLDNGGFIDNFKFNVRTLERLGVSAIMIEDKKGEKANSLFGDTKNQQQDSIEHFCEKIRQGKKIQVTKDFMIMARVESLILKMGMEDALKRAFAYVEAGADGIMIHSKEKSPSEIIEFCQKFRAQNQDTPIVLVPTTYNSITESEFEKMGANMVIYANHLLRAAYPAMMNVCKAILENERSLEVDNECMSINEIINLIPKLD